MNNHFSSFRNTRARCAAVSSHVLSLLCSPFPVLKASFLEFVHPLTSLKNKKCCPIAEDLSAPRGSNGNRGSNPGTDHSWLVLQVESLPGQPFQKGDERHDWPYILYHKTSKCNSNFARYDYSKCEFGYYGKHWAKKKILTSKNFLKLSAEK